MTLLAKRIIRHLEKGVPVQIGSPILQSWWIVEKCVEGPESGNIFCELVGVLRNKDEKLNRPCYKQTKVLVLTERINSKTGVVLDWRPQFSLGKLHSLVLSPIDFNHKVFPGWE